MVPNVRVIIHDLTELLRKERVRAHRMEFDNVNVKYIQLLQSLDTIIVLLRCH